MGLFCCKCCKFKALPDAKTNAQGQKICADCIEKMTRPKSPNINHNMTKRIRKNPDAFCDAILAQCSKGVQD